MITDGFELINFQEHLVGNGLSPGTAKEYSATVGRFLNRKPDIKDPEEYNKFLTETGAVKRHTYNYFYALKKYAEYKLDKKSEIDAIVKNMKLIKPSLQDRKTERAQLSDEKINTVINKLETLKHQLMARIQHETGLRISSVLWLRVKDVSNEVEADGTPIIRLFVRAKGGKTKTTYIFNPILISELNIFIKEYSTIISLPEEGIYETEYVFLELVKQKKHMLTIITEYSAMQTCYQKYWLDLKQALGSENIDAKAFASHDFRRGFARVFYIKTGKNIVALMEALGHTRIETTVRYLKDSGLMVKDNIRLIKEPRIITLEDNVIGTNPKGTILLLSGIKNLHRDTIQEFVDKKRIQFI